MYVQGRVQASMRDRSYHVSVSKNDFKFTFVITGKNYKMEMNNNQSMKIQLYNMCAHVHIVQAVGWLYTTVVQCTYTVYQINLWSVCFIIFNILLCNTPHTELSHYMYITYK